jgi:hypothetical protein
MTGGPGGGTTLDDSDIVRFVPTSLGANTAGSFDFYFEGSDVGLTQNDEDIDALGVLPNGHLVLSTVGTVSAFGPMPSNTISADDEDLLEFTPTSLGQATNGSWAFYFDGSDVGLTVNSEDVDGFAQTSTGALLLSTTGAFAVTGATGEDEDVFRFTSTSLGSTTAGGFAMSLDLSALGITTNVSAIEWVP